MSADASSTTKFCNAGTASHSPKSRIAQTNNEIRINPKHLITKPIKFMLELLPDIFRFLKDGVPGDAFGLTAAEVQEIIAGRVLLEDVGPIEFRMKVPYRGEGPWVLRSIILGEVRA